MSLNLRLIKKGKKISLYHCGEIIGAQYGTTHRAQDSFRLVTSSQ
jgi:hypothetical protein